MGFVNWLRKLGTFKVNENLEALGPATEDALQRVENQLRDHGIAMDEDQETARKRRIPERNCERIAPSAPHDSAGSIGAVGFDSGKWRE
jgi:hypothetical protein